MAGWANGYWRMNFKAFWPALFLCLSGQQEGTEEEMSELVEATLLP